MNLPYTMTPEMVADALGGGVFILNASIARIEGMDCLNIGFAIVSRAMFVGLKGAVAEMKRLIQ